MHQIIHNTLYELSHDPSVSKVFHTRVPKVITSLTKPLANTEKWLTQVYNGTFIDSKFDETWLGYNNINKHSLDYVIGDMDKVCSLFKECVHDCAKITDVYDAYDTFLYNTDTFRSGFLRHAMKISAIQLRNELVRILTKSTAKAIDNLQEKAMQPLWGAIQTFVDWHQTQAEALSLANYASVGLGELLTLNSLLRAFCEYLDEELETIVPGAFKVGGRFWWGFSKKMKTNFNMNLNPTSMEVDAGRLMAKSVVSKKVQLPSKPREFLTWSYPEKLAWTKKNMPQ